jgi:flagellar biosynthesis GTPase FlhF
MPHTSPDFIPETINIFLSSYSLNTTDVRRFVQFLGKVLFKFRLVFIARIWAQGFGIKDKDVEERIYIYMYVCTYVYVCAHTRKKERKREREEKKGEERKEKKKERKEKQRKKIKKRKRKREKDPRQDKKDIMRDDKSSEDQEKCEEGCDDVENESSIFHTMCNSTSRSIHTELRDASSGKQPPLHSILAEYCVVRVCLSLGQLGTTTT